MATILKVNQGGTGANLIATGGTSQVLKQVTVGGVVTVGQLAVGDITGTVLVANGGTGLTAGTSGGIPYFSSTSAIASSGALTASAIVLGGGAGASPTSLALGTANQILGMNNAGTANEYKTVSTSSTAVSNDVGVTLSGANALVINVPDASATVRGVITTGTQTFAGSKTFAAITTTTGMSQGSVTTNIFNSFLSSVGATVSTAEYKIGANNTQFRVGFRGNTATTATAGNDVWALLIGNNTYTEAASGTSALAGGVGIVTQSFTGGSGATTDFQNLYVGDAPTGGTNNWSINAGTINHRSKSTWDNTTTTVGTTGNQTINKSSGTVNIAAAGTTVTVTNSLVSATSLVFAVIRTADATARISNVVPAAGSFVVNIVACTAEVSIGFWVIN